MQFGIEQGLFLAGGAGISILSHVYRGLVNTNAVKRLGKSLKKSESVGEKQIVWKKISDQEKNTYRLEVSMPRIIFAIGLAGIVIRLPWIK
jgi:hypothetical protein